MQDRADGATRRIKGRGMFTSIVQLVIENGSDWKLWSATSVVSFLELREEQSSNQKKKNNYRDTKQWPKKSK